MNDGLPPITPDGTKLGIIMMELEKLHPGFAESCFRRAESEAHRACTIKLRGPKTEPAVVRELELAARWFGPLAVVASAFVSKKKRRK